MRRVVAYLAFAVLLTGCENPQKTADTLRAQIADFRVAPDDSKRLAIDQSFAKLEEQISGLEKRGDETRAEAMRDQFVSLRASYQEAKMTRAVNDAKNAIQGFGEAVRDGAKNLGDVFKSTNSSQ